MKDRPASWQIVCATLMAVVAGLSMVMFVMTPQVEGIWRHRGLATVSGSWKFAARATNVDKRYFVLYAATISAAMCAAMAACSHLHGDEMSVRLVLWELANLLLVVTSTDGLFADQFALYQLHQDVNSKEKALHAMVGMFCDGVVSVGADRDTMLQVTGSLLRDRGSEMSSCFPAAEFSRFQEALGRATYTPVLLHTVLLEKSKERTVDMYLVRSRSCVPPGEQQQQLSKASFVCGIRICVEDGLVGMEADAHFVSESEPIAQQARDLDVPAGPRDVDDCVSVAKTTATGHLFEEMIDAKSLKAFSQSMRAIQALGKDQHWFMPAHTVKLFPDRVLGGGAYGTVVLGLCHGEKVAVKLALCSLATTHSQLSLLRSLTNELRLLRYVRHANIVLLHGACVDTERGELGLVLDFVEGVRLTSFVTEGQVAPQDKHRVLMDICCALRYLHSLVPAIVHADLKGSNIIVQERAGRPHATLVDFGLSRLLTTAPKPIGGSLMWMAPEVILRSAAPSPAADVFSLGRLAYFVTTGLYPHAENKHLLVGMAESGTLEPLDWPDAENKLVPMCQQLTTKCLEYSPKARPSMSEVHSMVASWRPSADLEGEALDWGSGVQRLRDATALVAWSPSGPVSVVADFTDEFCAVLQATPSWVELFGENEDLTLADFFPKEEWAEFTAWAQMFAFSGKLVKYKQIRCMTVDGGQVEAIMKADFPERGESDEDSCYLFVVKLFDIRRMFGLAPAPVAGQACTPAALHPWPEEN